MAEVGILAWKRILRFPTVAGQRRTSAHRCTVTGFPGSSQSIRAPGSLCRVRLSSNSIGLPREEVKHHPGCRSR